MAQKLFVALLVLYFCSMLLTEIEAQSCGVFTTCGEEECCVSGLLPRSCSKGTKGEGCGGSSNCPCGEGLECDRKLVRGRRCVAKPITTTTAPTDTTNQTTIPAETTTTEQPTSTV